MRKESVAYTVGFAAVLSIVAGSLISIAAVTLHERHELNIELERKLNVLYAAGLISPEQKIARDQIGDHFRHIDSAVIDLETGLEAEGIDPETFDAKRTRLDPSTSHEVPDNPARVSRVEHQALVYFVRGQDGSIETVVLPVRGAGLWSTLYGFLAVEADGVTVKGLTFYQHGETPGLGGEVDNPKWKALWPGRRAYDDNGQPALEVIKGRAGSPEEDPFHVDGLTGATLTSRGVTNLVRFWLGDNGFRTFLTHLREGEVT